MRRALVTLLVLFVLVLSLVPASRAPGTPYTVRIYVTLEGAPLSGATVNVSLPKYGVSDTVAEISPGIYDVNLANDPYSNVSWWHGDTVRVDVYYGNYYEWATQKIDISEGYNLFTFDLEEEQYPPHAPAHPSPSHQATGVSRDVTLSVEVFDPNGDDLTVRFYNASGHTLMGTVADVSSGSTASVSWSGLAFNTTYSWYAVADDGLFTNQSDTWEFTTREPRIYTLTISVDPHEGGTVTLDPDRDYYYEEETVVMEAHPATGYVFDRWSGDIVGTNACKTITVYGNKTVTARFKPVQYTLNVTVDPPEGGTVACDPPAGPYDAGANVTLTAVPAEGYVFDRWQGDAAGNANPLNVTMDANRSISAHFAVNVPPSIAILFPPNNSTVSGAIAVEGTASDDNGNHTLHRVEIKIDDGDWQAATGTSAWHFFWNTTGVSDGPHVIHARAYDGHVYTENSTTVEVCNQVPVTRHRVRWAPHPWIPRNPDPGNVSVITQDDAVNFTVSSPRRDTVSTYYRWRWWNESSGLYEFWPTSDTPGAVNGSEIAVSSHSSQIQYNG
ncbi:MAG: InlB B-repeat-containing protein, partial [Thermoplasmatota archaeon]